MPPLSCDVSPYYGDDLSSCCSAQQRTNAKSSKPLTEQVTASLPKSSRRKRSVTFMGLVKVKNTLHIKDYTKEEVSAAWYNESESSTIKFTTKVVVSQMERATKKKGGEPVDEDTVSTRGLEGRTRKGQKKKFNARQEAQCAVLDEQYRQYAMDDFDPDHLALLYKECTYQSAIEAQRIGKQDEFAAFAL